jgi:hypothetical protein
MQTVAEWHVIALEDEIQARVIAPEGWAIKKVAI